MLVVIFDPPDLEDLLLLRSCLFQAPYVPPDHHQESRLSRCSLEFWLNHSAPENLFPCFLHFELDTFCIDNSQLISISWPGGCRSEWAKICWSRMLPLQKRQRTTRSTLHSPCSFKTLDVLCKTAQVGLLGSAWDDRPSTLGHHRCKLKGADILYFLGRLNSALILHGDITGKPSSLTHLPGPGSGTPLLLVVF